MVIYIRPYLLVAATDFGTTYSGYAFYFRNEYENVPCKISTNTWNAWSRALVSLKASTCVLFDLSKKFHALGYEAERKNVDVAADGIERTDIRWVLTVPAIWNDAAKQFMREAAEKADIPGDRLLIALEPEAVSIFCNIWLFLLMTILRKSEKMESIFSQARQAYLMASKDNSVLSRIYLENPTGKSEQQYYPES